VPKRAQYLRVIVAELQRSPRTASGSARGASTWAARSAAAPRVPLLHPRARVVLDLFESLTGARLLYGFTRSAGTRYDIPPAGRRRCARPSASSSERSTSTRTCSRATPSSSPHPGRGRLARARPGGRHLRAAHPRLRHRLRHPPRGALLLLRGLRLQGAVETAGDCYARYRVRMVEFRESIKIVRQALDGLPEGPISSRPGVKSVGQVRMRRARGMRVSRARAARWAATS
jgi:NADH:ubiquinone oxidoreductase subunit D